MIKRLILSLAIGLGLTSAHAAGTIPFSLSQQFDSLGKPLAACKFYTIQAGTTSTPQNAYQDSALTNALPNPQTCDSAGRLPQMFLADGTIKVRLTDRNGVTIVVADNVQVIGPSGGGGGGGGTVDPTTIAATGDLKASYGTAVLSGWVRANGRTIGSATSGATERANSDCQALFVYLWGADANLTVSGGRGASAAADWAANKTIALPDWRGRTIAGLDDMGASSAGRLTASYFGTGPTTLGSAGSSSESTTLVANQLPSSIPYTDPGHTHAVVITPAKNLDSTNTPPYLAGGAINSFDKTYTSASATTGITINPSGGNPHRTVQPTMLATIYVKL